jgi:hypothetical protein
MAERLISLSEPELERALVDLGRHVAYPPTPDLAAAMRASGEIAQRPAAQESLAAARLRSWWQTLVPAQRRLAYALVALIALAGAILAFSPEARTAVAERLGLRGVVIREIPAAPTPVPTANASAAAQATPVGATIAQPTPMGGDASPVIPPVTSVGARLSLGQSTTLDEVQTRVTFQVLVPSLLGKPDEVYLGNAPPGGQVALVYYPRQDLPQANTTGVGLLLTAFQGSVPASFFGKGIPPGTRLAEVQVNGGSGYWIEGDPHTFFYLDSRGQGRSETTRLAGNVLLWEQNQLTLRIESALPKDQVLRIAASVQ